MSNKRRKRERRFPVKKINRQISRKLAGLFLAALLALVGLTLVITYVNASSGEAYRRMVLQNTQQQYVNRTLPFKRGDIYDRNGTILATSERVYNLVLDCKVINYVEKDENGNNVQPYIEPTIALAVEMFGVDEADLRNRITSEETKESQYQVIKQDVTMEEKEAYEARTNTDDENLTKEERNERMNYNGLWFEETYKRVYPQNSLACDLIGFCSSLNSASYGIEGFYNDTLNGANGRAFGYFNSDSDVEQTIIRATDGNNVVSTIDVNVQEIIRGAIQNYQNHFENGPNGVAAAENIAVIVMDPNTGEILGMDSSDWYDLNDPRDLSMVADDGKFAGLTESEKLASVWRNFCISDAYEPGSTAKPFTIAAALDTDSIKIDDKFECDGYEFIDEILIRCAVFPDFHGEMTTEGIIINSCNDAMMQVAEKLGPENFLRYQNIFGFGKRTGIDLPAESPGILYALENMGKVELATSTFGQGFTCTMMQEAAAMCSIINGGYYYIPHVVKMVTDSSGNLIENNEAVVERQTVSANTSSFIKFAMQKAMLSGTGQTAKVAGYTMGGKTGTAQKLPRDSGNYLISFIGFAPVADPQVLVYVVVDQPNVSDQDESTLAQLIAKQIFTELLPYMNIFPDEAGSASEEYNEDIYAAYMATLPDVYYSGEEAAAPQEQPAETAGDQAAQETGSAEDVTVLPEGVAVPEASTEEAAAEGEQGLPADAAEGQQPEQQAEAQTENAAPPPGSTEAAGQ